MTPQIEAINLLEELGIVELPILPEEICSSLGIDYCEDHMKNLDGFLLLNAGNNKRLICVNELISEQGRKNFTIAHEFGHLCMDSINQSEFYCSRDVIESFKPTIDPIELRANEFAAEFLMPKFIYQPLVSARSPSWNQIKDLAVLSQTTLTATAIRFVDLTEDACCIIVSHEGRLIWFRKSTEFHPYIQMDSRILSPGTIAYSIFKGNIPPDHFEDVKADNWLSGKGVTRYTEILEWSLPLNSYGLVLTLLYDEEGIQGWEEDDETNEDDEVEWEPMTFHKSRRKK